VVTHFVQRQGRLKTRMMWLSSIETTSVKYSAILTQCQHVKNE